MITQSKQKEKDKAFNEHQMNKNEQIASHGAEYFRNKAQTNPNVNASNNIP